jgi:hypothetical protein
MCSKFVGAVGLCEAPKDVYVGVCWRGSGCSVHNFVMFPDLDDEDTVIPFFSSRLLYILCPSRVWLRCRSVFSVPLV